MLRFEKEFGADPDLARKMVDDPYKSPEMQQMAQEYLDSLDSSED